MRCVSWRKRLVSAVGVPQLTLSALRQPAPELHFECGFVRKCLLEHRGDGRRHRLGKTRVEERFSPRTARSIKSVVPSIHHASTARPYAAVALAGDER
jgi:hypothetical protein